MATRKKIGARPSTAVKKPVKTTSTATATTTKAIEQVEHELQKKLELAAQRKQKKKGYDSDIYPKVADLDPVICLRVMIDAQGMYLKDAQIERLLKVANNRFYEAARRCIIYVRTQARARGDWDTAKLMRRKMDVYVSEMFDFEHLSLIDPSIGGALREMHYG
jgi:hypothetical protein